MTPPDSVVRHWPVALVLASAMFMVLFDSLAVATALPRIGEGLGLRRSALQWVVSLYSLSIGGLLLLGGRVCDLCGRRRVLLASLSLSAAGSLLAGLAPGLGLLLTGRALQGVAAAFAIPATLAAAGSLFPDEPWRSRVFSVIAVAANSAGLAGAICGGLLTAAFGWRWVFLATVPVSVAAVAAAAAFVPHAAAGAGVSGRLDVGGALLATGGLVALIYGIGQVAQAGATSPRALLPASGGLLLLAGLVAVERRVCHPLVNPRLLRSRSLVGSCLTFFAHCAAYTAVVVVGSLYLQDVHGLSAAGAGIALAPVLVASLSSTTLAGLLVRRFGSRTVVVGALALGSVALALVARGMDGSLVSVLPWLYAWGLSAGPVYVALTRECIGSAPSADRGTTSALFESTSHVAGAIAVAVYLSLLEADIGYAGVELAGALVIGAGALAALAVLPRSRHDGAQPVEEQPLP